LRVPLPKAWVASLLPWLFFEHFADVREVTLTKLMDVVPEGEGEIIQARALTLFL
jgi:hypothetical protein